MTIGFGIVLIVIIIIAALIDTVDPDGRLFQIDKDNDDDSTDYF